MNGRTGIPLMLLFVAATLYLVMQLKVVYSETLDPSGEYTAVVSYKNYLSFIPVSASEKEFRKGYIRIHDSQGADYGEAPLVSLSLASQLEWFPGGARIPGLVEWHFADREIIFREAGERTRETLDAS